MKKLYILICALVALVISPAAFAATWIAICNDGKNIQYNQTLKGNGFLYMKVKNAKGKYRTWQIAKLKQTFYNKTVICGSVLKNGKGNTATGGRPITQICANKDRKNIYVKYKQPYKKKPSESGVYCTADIKIKETKKRQTESTRTPRTRLIQRDTTAVWRGFTHAWVGEVHRTGVFGNWIKVDNQTTLPKGFSAHHWAQTGTSKDSASFSSKYTLLEATNTRFVPGKIKQFVRIMEGAEKSFSQAVLLSRTAANQLADKGKVDVILNGFRIEKRSPWEAKKLGILEVEVTKPTVTRSSIKFFVKGRIMVSCKSAECAKFKKKGEYNIVVFYNVVASKANQFNSVRHDTLIRSYPYDTRRGEVPESLGNLNGKRLNPIPTYGDYEANVIGIRKFRFHASKKESPAKPDNVPHLYKWKMWVKQARISDPDAGKLRGMAFFAHSNKGITNVGHTGNVRIEVDLVTLQFKSGVSKECAWSRTKAFGNASSGKYKYSKSGTLSFGKLTCFSGRKR